METLRPEFRKLLSAPGIGPILGLTIMLETGDIRRFPQVGDFASYCRCVESQRLSNKKKKGKGNTKNGNKYLGWAFVEAANFAVRSYPSIQKGLTLVLVFARINVMLNYQCTPPHRLEAFQAPPGPRPD